MKKKIVVCILSAFMALSPTSVFGASLDEQISTIETQIQELQTQLSELKKQKAAESGAEYIPTSEYQALFTDASGYEGKDIQIAGKMFRSMEQDDEYKYFQMFYNLNGEDKNIIVACPLSSPDFVENDYVLVTGKVNGTVLGQNAFGGDVRALSITAEIAEKTDYANAVNPSIKTVEVNLPLDQYGYVITINKVEFAESETRLYVTMTNNGLSTFYCYSSSAKIVQGNTQYETQYNYDADYQEPQSDLLPGTETSGIITFPPLDPNSSISVYFDGSSDNYDENLNTYQFDIGIGQ